MLSGKPNNPCPGRSSLTRPPPKVKHPAAFTPTLTLTPTLNPILTFSIITPSFRNSQWLRLCINSIADQQEVQVEHIVQDSCSDDGTQDWLPKEPRVKSFIEKDRGMYDAVNRGFDRATGDILAYLNCDEQYLPGALKMVRDLFEAQPQIDVVLADSIVTDPEGNYVCHRASLVPFESLMWVRFSVLTCSMFVRRRVVRELGIRFDTQWLALGDWFWIMEMVRKGVRMAVLPRLTSVFADTGDNLCLKPRALEERRIKWQMAPAWVKLLKYPIIIHHRLRLTLRPPFMLKPFDYSLYTLCSPGQRVTRHAAKPTSFWKGRLGK